MNNISIMSRNRIISQILMILVLVSLPLMQSYARMGCCARHGGVAGCNNSTGYQKCNDGTTSPSCKCDGTTAAKPKTVAPRVTKTPAEPAKTVVKPTTPAKAVKAAPATKITGCCSRHGGVSKCNKSKGYQMCKDGTLSPVCKCS